ncbi:MAG: hypothetical protein JW864_08255 [Spirochaetes bacterium]|nr:hypothetical protein [Spirochaetota bacterium]
MKNIGLIINPYSKKMMRLKDPVEYYRKVCGDVADIRLTKTIEDLDKAVEDFKKNSVSYVAISGGDGSIHNVISGLFKTYGSTDLPYILILKDGSMNNIAKSYKLKGYGAGLMKKLVSAIDNSKQINIVYRNTIAVGYRCCFLFGLGFTATFINEFNRGGRKSPYKAIRIMMKSIFEGFKKEKSSMIKQMKMKLTADGKQVPIENYYVIYASTIKNLALGFNPTPRAYEKENSFQLIASGMSPLHVLLKMDKIRKGIRIVSPDHYDDVVSELEILYPGEFWYQMDGDIYTAQDKLLVTAGPRIGFVSI